MDKILLRKYIEGRISTEEEIIVADWLKKDEENMREYMSLRTLYNLSLWYDVNQNKTPVTKEKYRKIIPKLFQAAAIFILLLGGLYSYYINNKADDLIQQNLYIPSGQRAEITLVDGTKVWLNSKTKFVFPNRFSSDSREVYLDGEAYFQVAKQDEKSFIVKTNKYNIEVLGTSFNVNAYADKPSFSTVLVSGSIKLFNASEKQPIYLIPGETAELVDSKIVISSEPSEVHRWRDGLIVIEDKNFVEIMQLFEKYFGVEILILNDKLKEMEYRGKLRIADGIDHAFYVLQKYFPFNYKKDEKTNCINIY